jgi:hypothetical protein
MRPQSTILSRQASRMKIILTIKTAKMAKRRTIRLERKAISTGCQEQLSRSLVALKFAKHRVGLLCGALAESEVSQAPEREERRSNEFEQMASRFKR